MKLIMAIVNKKDVKSVCQALMKDGFQFTKISSIGGFLTVGNTTLIIGTEDDKLEKGLDIIRNHCKKRVVKVPSLMYSNAMYPSSLPMDVIVGGAIVFVSNVERFEKM